MVNFGASIREPGCVGISAMSASPSLGVIFDWDGVIIDSSRQHETSWELLAAEVRRELPPDHFVLGFGKKNEWIIPNLLKWTDVSEDVARLSLRKEALYREVVARDGLHVLPGVVPFLERLRAAGIAFCVGSSTHRANIEAALDRLGMQGIFNERITAEDVTQGKPHPEVFLKAAQRLGVPPQACVVFEDAFAGIEAAKAGGMKVVGVATTHPEEVLRPKVDHVVRRLDELSVADLHQLVEGGRLY